MQHDNQPSMIELDTSIYPLPKPTKPKDPPPPSNQFVIGTVNEPILSSHLIGKSGDAIATPPAPQEYMIVNFNGELRKIPLYNM